MNENELIAEFMGFKHLPHLDDETWGKAYCKTKHDNFYISKAKYDTSWDWFMPVVDKINTLEDGGDLKGLDIDILRSMHDWISRVNIKNAHGDAALIIKWYSQTKSES